MKKIAYQRFTIFLLLLSMLVSCKANTDTIATDTESSDTETISEDTMPVEEVLELPDMDWEGRQFRVLGYEGLKQFTTFEVDAEGETGAVVNDAIFRRNTVVEDRYNVEIVQTLDNSESDGRNATTPVVRKLVLAGEDAYDLVFLPFATGGTIVRENMLYDLNTTEYIDLEKSWWNQTVREDLEIGGKLFLAASDFSLRDKNRAYIMCVNLEMLNAYNLASPVEMVRAGTWTMDAFNESCLVVADDLNGNGEVDDEDRFGVGLDSPYGFVAMLTGCGVSMMTNKNGTPALNLNTEHTIDAIDKVLEIYSLKNVAAMCNDWEGKVSYSYTSFTSRLFKNGRMLFITCFPHSLQGYSADCVNEYGIVPYPKFNEQQEGYYSYADVFCMLFGIPTTTPEPEFAGFMLEALSHEATDTSLHAYYEITCKTKYAYDPDSAEMLDLIFDGLRFEPAVMYQITGNDIFFDIGFSRENNFSSAYAAKQTSILTDIEALMENINSVE